MKTTYNLEVISYSSQEVIIDESLSEKKFNTIKNRLEGNFYKIIKEELVEEELHNIITTTEYVINDTQVILTKVESK